jgi:hypothetical protein
MKLKTSELIGPALDYAVAKCMEQGKPAGYWTGAVERKNFDPSANWSQGGPIIERERIKVAPNLNGTWHGQIRHTKAHPLVAHPVLAGWTNKHGPTSLIAAMRCYVASKLGDEVDIPEELL